MSEKVIGTRRSLGAAMTVKTGAGKPYEAPGKATVPAAAASAAPVSAVPDTLSITSPTDRVDGVRIIEVPEEPAKPSAPAIEDLSLGAAMAVAEATETIVVHPGGVAPEAEAAAGAAQDEEISEAVIRNGGEPEAVTERLAADAKSEAAGQEAGGQEAGGDKATADKSAEKPEAMKPQGEKPTYAARFREVRAKMLPIRKAIHDLPTVEGNKSEIEKRKRALDQKLLAAMEEMAELYREMMAESGRKVAHSGVQVTLDAVVIDLGNGQFIADDGRGLTAAYPKDKARSAIGAVVELAKKQGWPSLEISGTKDKKTQELIYKIALEAGFEPHQVVLNGQPFRLPKPVPRAEAVVRQGDSVTPSLKQQLAGNLSADTRAAARNVADGLNPPPRTIGQMAGRIVDQVTQPLPPQGPTLAQQAGRERGRIAPIFDTPTPG